MKYLWLDLETTGTDPDEDVIIEIAAVASGPLPDLRLDPLTFVDSVILAKVQWEFVAPFVQNMHSQNGLRTAMTLGWGHDLDLIENMLVRSIADITWDDEKPILAGSTPHFDRGFIRAYMPLLDRALHYRHFDVSTLKMAAKDLGQPFAKVDAHRALADVRQSMQHAKDALQQLSSQSSGGVVP